MEHLRCLSFDKMTIYRGFGVFLTLTRSKADHKNQTIPFSADHTIQKARPWWMNTNAILTHCWIPHAFSLIISLCFLIRVIFNKKGFPERKNIWATAILPPPYGRLNFTPQLLLKSWTPQLLQSRNKSILCKELKWKERKSVLRLHEQYGFVSWFILEEGEEEKLKYFFRNSSNKQALGAAILTSHTTACLQVLDKSGILLAWFQENRFSPSKDISLNILAVAIWMSFNLSSYPFPEGDKNLFLLLLKRI